jgi:citrate lyase subunit beta/citryl-CoA lyase
MMRSLLFAPANRDKFVLNFAKLNADAYCIDLEDGTPAAEKDAARAALPALVSRLRQGRLSGPLLVRINDPATDLGRRDLAAVRLLAVDGVMVPKVSTPDDLRRCDAPGVVVALIETVRGIAHARAIAAAARPGTVIAFGAEDFATDIGARRTAEGREVLFARSEVVLAAKLHDLAAIDQVVVEVRDDARFAADARAGRDLGYDGKMCLTPRQAEQANAEFAPSAGEIDFARRLIAAFEDAERRSLGAFDFEGRMVDEPLVKRARKILASVR